MDKKSVNDIMENLKSLVKKGNVSRIVISKDDKELVNIPVNVGIVGGVVGLAAAKWVVIAAVLATVGFGCAVQVVKEDGEITDVFGKEQADKARAKATEIVEDVKEKLNLDEVVSKATDAVSEVKEKFTFDEVVDATVEDIKDEPTEEQKITYEKKRMPGHPLFLAAGARLVEPGARRFLPAVSRKRRSCRRWPRQVPGSRRRAGS